MSERPGGHCPCCHRSVCFKHPCSALFICMRHGSSRCDFPVEKNCRSDSSCLLTSVFSMSRVISTVRLTICRAGNLSCSSLLGRWRSGGTMTSLQSRGGKKGANQDIDRELLTFEVQAVVPGMPDLVLKSCDSAAVRVCSQLVLLISTASAYLKLRMVSLSPCSTPSISSV